VSVSDYYRTARDKAFSELEDMDPATIANSDSQEVMRYFQDKYFLPGLEKDENREELRNTDILVDGVKITLIYPLKMDVNVRVAAELRPSSVRFGSRIEYWPEKNCFMTSEIIPNGASNGSERIMGAREVILDRINSINTDVRNGNQGLQEAISIRYLALKKQRVKQLADVDSWIKKLPVKLIEVPSGSAPTPLKLPVNPKIVSIIQDKKKPEPSLDRSQVSMIVELINNTGHYFERTPKTMAKLEEEELRDLILGGLNMHFKGATGETFSKGGKTDIHYSHSSKDVLIAECKKWQGEATYDETIDQLFRYTTWRDLFGIVITFSNNKNFTDVIEKAKSETKKHPTYVANSIQEPGTGHFISKHIKAEDEARHIEVHHLLFTLYVQAS
jgi:hypothetical protein